MENSNPKKERPIHTPGYFTWAERGWLNHLTRFR